MPLILGTNSIKDTGYDVANSLRLNQASSDYLNRTNGSSTGKIWTFSCWFKICDPGDTNMNIFNVSSDANNTTYVEVAAKSQNGLDVQVRNGEGTTYIRRRSSAILRDVSAWYNVIVIFDSTNSTADDRIKVFLNGSRITSFQENVGTVDADYVTQIGVSGAAVEIGRNTSAAHYYDGYLAEMVLVDGTALSTTDLGEFDSDSPTIWKPKDVSGLTFGTNGFYLDFENASSLGADVSGNSNNFTVNNLTSVDQSTDTCTNNFATMNPLANKIANATFSEGNLKIAMSSNKGGNISTIGFTTGKWYAEMKIVSIPTDERWHWGIIPHDNYVSDDPINTGNDGIMISAFNATIYANNGSGHTIISNFFGNSTSAFDSFSGIMGLAIDATSSTKTIAMSKDGAWITGTGTTDSSFSNALKVDISTAFARYPSWHIGTGTGTTAGNGVFSVNFGSPEFSISSGNSDANGFGNFEYAVPSGYFSLCTKNLAEFG
jgi:hypothetical protein